MYVRYPAACASASHNKLLLVVTGVPECGASQGLWLYVYSRVFARTYVMKASRGTRNARNG
eukprot:39762-Eustigmatos_ZCMA.PRE.1